jgi:hypothetical protein
MAELLGTLSKITSSLEIAKDLFLKISDPEVHPLFQQYIPAEKKLIEKLHSDSDHNKKYFTRYLPGSEQLKQNKMSNVPYFPHHFPLSPSPVVPRYMNHNLPHHFPPPPPPLAEGPPASHMSITSSPTIEAKVTQILENQHHLEVRLNEIAQAIRSLPTADKINELIDLLKTKN